MKFLSSFVFALTVLLFASTASAQMPVRQAGNIGVGIGAGTLATGLSIKYFTSASTSIQGNVGFWRGRFGGNGRFYRNDALAVSGDFLLERGPLLGDADVTLDWSIGAGAGVGFDDNANIGIAAAGVAGLELNVHAIPIDLVIEYRPGLLIVPDVDLDLVNFTGHIRYYF